jgi:hypothetical protein
MLANISAHIDLVGNFISPSGGPTSSQIELLERNKV